MSMENIKYVNIKAAGAVGDGETDCSKYFDTDAEGFEINDGVYAIDAETIVRLTQMPVKGNGTVKYKDFKQYFTGRFTSTPFDGTIPVSKLHDELYTSMNLPHEAYNYVEEFCNPINMNAPEKDFLRCNAMGAICLTNGAEVDDDDMVTFCFGKSVMVVKYKNQPDWVYAQYEPFPVQEHYLYDLPWQHGDQHSRRIESKYIKDFWDHVEVTVPARELNHGLADGADQSVLHYWNKAYTLWDGGDNLEGVAVSFVVWVKDAKHSGKFNTAPSADFYGDVVRGGQVYEGRNYTLTDKPRVMVGHNVGNADYDRIMNVEKVSKMLGL